ncbi:hypothetical protein [Bradyrhizobium paxllaeri]|uniref:hypothetical protein n=1 Tax=Bradyrhizobium paxllaeri TaxID=190148 RepID=UPI00081077ED|nr:hypothetical protein [Bradyrhizobium paxllaeri]
MAEGDGRYFAWVRCVAPWTEPKLHPQIIRDLGVVDYIETQQRLTHERRFAIVGGKHVLKIEEYDLTIAQLETIYPAPPLSEEP